VPFVISSQRAGQLPKHLGFSVLLGLQSLDMSPEIVELVTMREFRIPLVETVDISAEPSIGGIETSHLSGSDVIGTF